MDTVHRRLLADIYEMSRKHIGGVSSYIEERKLTPLADKFGLGFIPSLSAIYSELREKEWNPAEAFEAGLDLGIVYAINKEQNVYGSILEGRITFPIFDPYGRIIAISGRTLQNAKPKYYNTVFKKGDHLFGLHLAEKEIIEKNFVIIVEGYTDVMAAHSIGIHNIVATMGTALTKKQCILLARYTNHAFILFDSDAAGTRSAKSFLDKKALNPLLLKVDSRTLPGKTSKDLDELVKRSPDAAYEFLTKTILDRV